MTTRPEAIEYHADDSTTARVRFVYVDEFGRPVGARDSFDPSEIDGYGPDEWEHHANELADLASDSGLWCETVRPVRVELLGHIVDDPTARTGRAFRALEGNRPRTLHTFPANTPVVHCC